MTTLKLVFSSSSDALPIIKIKTNRDSQTATVFITDRSSRLHPCYFSLDSTLTNFKNLQQFKGPPNNYLNNQRLLSLSKKRPIRWYHLKPILNWWHTPFKGYFLWPDLNKETWMARVVCLVVGESGLTILRKAGFSISPPSKQRPNEHDLKGDNLILTH